MASWRFCSTQIILDHANVDSDTVYCTEVLIGGKQYIVLADLPKEYYIPGYEIGYPKFTDGIAALRFFIDLLPDASVIVIRHVLHDDQKPCLFRPVLMVLCPADKEEGYTFIKIILNDHLNKTMTRIILKREGITTAKLSTFSFDDLPVFVQNRFE